MHPQQQISRGPAALVELRKTASLTQEQLAEAAGLSVRAVRNLETGRVTAPQRHTQDALVRALGLTETHALEFRAAWQAPGEAAGFADLVRSGADIETLLALANSGLRDRTVYEQVRIGRDRLLLANRNVAVVEAVEDDVSGRVILWGDEPGLDVTRVRVEGEHGCTVAPAQPITELDLVAFQLGFDPPLALGETRLLEYTVDLQDAYDPTIAVPTPEYEHGFRQAVDVLALEVVFDEVPPPRRAWMTRRLPHQAQTRRPRPVEGNRITSTVRNAPPGLHGLAWEW